MSIITGTINKFKQYSKFSSIKDFNNNIEMWLAEYKNQFTKSELIALKRLIRFSAKVYGVANASINTVLKAINTLANGFGISESTFQRMKRKAIKLGILSVKETKRANGSQSSNLWVFNRYQVLSNSNTIDTPKEPEKESNESGQVHEPQKNISDQRGNKQLTPLKTTKIQTNNINNNVIDVEQLDSSFTGSFVPKQFIMTVKPFFDNAKIIEKYYYKFKNAVDQHNSIYEMDYTTLDLIHVAIRAFKQTVRKHNKIKNMFNYFFVTCGFMLDELVIGE